MTSPTIRGFRKFGEEFPRLLHHHVLPYPEKWELLGVAELLSDLNAVPLVILVRDPKDTLYSCYLHHLHRGFGYVRGGRYAMVEKFAGTVDQFVHESPLGFHKWVAYYNELATVRSSCRAPTLVMPYQSLYADTAGALKQVADTLQITNTNERMFAVAVERCRIDNMQTIENRSTSDTTPIPNLFSQHNSTFNSRKARVGGAGSWKGHLTDSAARRIDDYARINLHPLYNDLGTRLAPTQSR